MKRDLIKYTLSYNHRPDINIGCYHKTNKLVCITTAIFFDALRTTSALVGIDRNIIQGKGPNVAGPDYLDITLVIFLLSLYANIVHNLKLMLINTHIFGVNVHRKYDCFFI